MPNQDKKEDDDNEQISVVKTQKDAGSSESSEDMEMDTQQVQERLGLGLKNMYQSVLDEPLPDAMMALLDQLGDIDDDPGSDASSHE